MKIAVAGATGVLGRHISEAATAGGHYVVALSRSSGVDLLDRDAVNRAVAGCDLIIDAANSKSISQGSAIRFFEAASTNLATAAQQQGVGHVVTVSIVGIDRASGYGYYAAKLAQEAVVRGGPAPWSIVRATQFHEFPTQILARASIGPVAMVPSMAVQTVSARALGEYLVNVGVAGPTRSHVEVGGPTPGDLADLARRFLKHFSLHTAVVAPKVPGKLGRVLRNGALRPQPGGAIIGGEFDEWLTTSDAAERAALLSSER